MQRKGFDGSRLEWRRGYKEGAGFDRKGEASSSEAEGRTDGYPCVWMEGAHLSSVAGSQVPPEPSWKQTKHAGLLRIMPVKDQWDSRQDWEGKASGHKDKVAAARLGTG